MQTPYLAVDNETAGLDIARFHEKEEFARRKRSKKRRVHGTRSALVGKRTFRSRLESRRRFSRRYEITIIETRAVPVPKTQPFIVAGRCVANLIELFLHGSLASIIERLGKFMG